VPSRNASSSRLSASRTPSGTWLLDSVALSGGSSGSAPARRMQSPPADEDYRRRGRPPAGPALRVERNVSPAPSTARTRRSETPPAPLLEPAHDHDPAALRERLRGVLGLVAPDDHGEERRLQLPPTRHRHPEHGPGDPTRSRRCATSTSWPTGTPPRPRAEPADRGHLSAARSRSTVGPKLSVLLA
jgi:hypothetical protein